MSSTQKRINVLEGSGPNRLSNVDKNTISAFNKTNKQFLG